MRFRWILTVAALNACDGGDPADTDEGSDTTDTADTSDTSDTSDTNDTSDNPTGDEGLVRDLIEGNQDVDAVLANVSWSDGFPVATESGTYIFVLQESEGEFSLHGDFTNWAGEDQPIPMTQGDGFFWAEVEISNPEGQRYKFMNDGGDWADDWSRSFTYDQYGEISFVRPPSDQYRLDRWVGMIGEGLQERDLQVLGPPGEGPWPVLYMHDGQNLFDPEAAFGRWDIQGAVEAGGEEVLVVGINNTSDRMSEYVHVPDNLGDGTYASVGADYAALVQEDIRPFIEDTYGTNGLNGVMGSSLGGLISLYIAHQYPGEFDFVGSLSGTLGWGRFGLSNPTVQELWEDDDFQDIVIYADSGGGPGGDNECTDPDEDGFTEDDPDSSDNYCETRQFVDSMAENGYTWDQNLFHWWVPDAPHNEGAWAERVDDAIAIFLAIDDES